MPRHIPASWFACDGLRFVNPAQLDEEMLAVYERIVTGQIERDVILSMVRASLEPQEPMILPASLTPLDEKGEPEERHTLPTRRRLIEAEHARLLAMEESREMRQTWLNIYDENTNWKSPRDR